jgi:hypothetical protein
MKPTDKVLKAIASLKDNPHFQEVVEWLKWERDDAALSSCHEATDVGSRWIQGHAQILEKLLVIINHAEEKLVARKEPAKHGVIV